MNNDKITLKDLSVFAANGEDVFALLNHTTTSEGREALRRHILAPPQTPEGLLRMQSVSKWWAANPTAWTKAITNGTLVMLEKFFEAADSIGAPPTGISLVLGSFFQKLINRNQYTFVQFSVAQLADFLRGCTELVKLLERADLPPLLKQELEAMAAELDLPVVAPILAVTPKTPFQELSRIAYRARRELKNAAFRLQDHYARIDAWQALGAAAVANGWHFPELLPEAGAVLEAKGLFHPLLAKPVGYDVAFSEGRNLMLLTGANMSGKTTFLRALGLGALLAHLGSAVPAAAMRISFLQGVITNMHVEDNILRGESYFFAEVLRMKQTAQQLGGAGSNLVLMDELFKGTNVHDAYECTRAIVEGLLRQPRHLMILSTHLHEVAQHFSGDKRILFALFVTEMGGDGGFKFTYELRPGISDDRIGYRILQQEGVIDLLKGE